MSEFNDFIGSAFGQAAEVFGSDTLTVGPITVPCVAASPQLSAALRDSGFFDQVSVTATLARADFAALGLGNRSAVDLNGRPMKVMVLEDDGVCPIVTVHLKKQN